MRRPYTPAPTEGPAGVDHLYRVKDPTRVVGGMTILATEAPHQVPVRVMPEPYPIAHRLIPFMVSHEYGPPYIPESRNRGRLEFPSPAATVVPGEMRAYPLRVNYRRPTLVEPGDRTP